MARTRTQITTSSHSEPQTATKRMGTRRSDSRRRTSPSQHEPHRTHTFNVAAEDEQVDMVINRRTRTGSSSGSRRWGLNYYQSIGIVLSIAVSILVSGPQSVSAGFACLSNPCVFGVCVDDLNRWVQIGLLVNNKFNKKWWKLNYQCKRLVVSKSTHVMSNTLTINLNVNLRSAFFRLSSSIAWQMKCNDIICPRLTKWTVLLYSWCPNSKQNICSIRPTNDKEWNSDRKETIQLCPSHCEFNEDTVSNSLLSLITYLQSASRSLLKHTVGGGIIIKHTYAPTPVLHCIVHFPVGLSLHSCVRFLLFVERSRRF